MFFGLLTHQCQDQKSNRVRKALHTQSHSDLRVCIKLVKSTFAQNFACKKMSSLNLYTKYCLAKLCHTPLKQCWYTRLLLLQATKISDSQWYNISLYLYLQHKKSLYLEIQAGCWQKAKLKCLQISIAKQRFIWVASISSPQFTVCRSEDIWAPNIHSTISSNTIVKALFLILQAF